MTKSEFIRSALRDKVSHDALDSKSLIETLTLQFSGILFLAGFFTIFIWLLGNPAVVSMSFGLLAPLLLVSTYKVLEATGEQWLMKKVSELYADERGAMGIFMVLIFGVIALIVTTIVILFGMDITGSFAEGVGQNQDTYSTDEAIEGSQSAFDLFSTSLLVIPAASVLAVLIGGMVGAISSGNMPGMNRISRRLQNGDSRRRRGR